MALVSRTKIWVAGDILTASDLNNEFQVLYDVVNGNLTSPNIGTLATLTFSNSTASSTILTATKTNTGNFLELTGSNRTTTIDASGIVHTAASNANWVSNLGCTLASGTFTITGYDATALSSTNTAWVTVPHTTSGKHIRLQVSSPVSFNDDAYSGTSDIDNELFGTTTGVAWGNDAPFFLYAVNTADTSAGLYFAISRNPCATASPSSSTNIGYKLNPASAGSERDFWFLTSTDVTTQTSKPCQLIGAFRMRKSAGDDWTVQTLGATDGIGPHALRGTFAKEWTLPAGQNGAATGAYMQNSGGTAALFTTNSPLYYIKPDGFCQLEYYFNGDPGTDGAGAGQAILAAPYEYRGAQAGYATHYLNSVGTGPVTGYALINTGTPAILLYWITGGALTAVTTGNFSNGARTVSLRVAYPAFVI